MVIRKTVEETDGEDHWFHILDSRTDLELDKNRDLSRNDSLEIAKPVQTARMVQV